MTDGIEVIGNRNNIGNVNSISSANENISFGNKPSMAVGIEPAADPVDKVLQSFRKGFVYPNKSTKIIDDPTFLGFTLMFDFKESKLFKGYSSIDSSGKVTGDLDSDCAFAYLNRNGEKTRMTYLKSFVDQLIYINTYKSYFWQSLEGLDTLWADLNDFKKMPIASEWEIIIKTLETIDLKIFGLMELYRKAAYDYDYVRQVLPINLQRFNLTIYINEMRTFRPNSHKIGNNKINSLGNIDGKIDLEAALGLNDVYGEFNFQNVMNRIKGAQSGDAIDTDQALDDLVGWLNKDEHGIIVSLTGCKFNPSGGGGPLSTFTNVSSEQASNELKIAFKSASVNSVLAWYQEKITSETDDSSLKDSSMWDQIKNRSQSLLEGATRDYLNKAKRNLKGRVGSLIKDNVPGGLLGTVQELQRGNLMNAISALSNKSLGSVYEPPTNDRNSNPNYLGKIY